MKKYSYHTVRSIILFKLITQKIEKNIYIFIFIIIIINYFIKLCEYRNILINNKKYFIYKFLIILCYYVIILFENKLINLITIKIR